MGTLYSGTESRLASPYLKSLRLLDDRAAMLLLKEAPGASALPHSGRSFLEHLVGTWWILGQWQMPRVVCRAGLLHSCYSTVFYPHALFAIRDRSKVRAIIGRHAEALAYRFCVIDRSELWDLAAEMSSLRKGLKVRRIDSDRPMFLPERTARNLLLIESANLAEQGSARDGLPTPWMSRLASWSQLLGRGGLPVPLHLCPTLTTAAERQAIEKYSAATNAPSSPLPSLLDAAIKLNPWAGEPRILRALYALECRETARAFSEAVRGHALISAWAVAWDKRLSLGAWLNLGTTVMQRAAGVGRGGKFNLTCESVRAVLAKTSHGHGRRINAQRNQT